MMVIGIASRGGDRVSISALVASRRRFQYRGPGFSGAPIISNDWHPLLQQPFG